MKGPSNLQLADSKESSPRSLQGPGLVVNYQGKEIIRKRVQRHIREPSLGCQSSEPGRLFLYLRGVRGTMPHA